MKGISKTAGSFTLTHIAAIALVPFALSSGQVMAQATSNEDRTEDKATLDSGRADGEIIVTARRVEENLQDVPIAVTVLGGADLRERQVHSAADLQYNVPSLSVTPSVGGNSANYGLRGQRQGIGNTQGVVTYFAEIPVSADSTYRQTFDMASIQVLKGPQGTLFGANSNGGAILFVPQKPTDRFEGEIQAATGSYSLGDFTGILNVPIADWIKLRVAGNIVRRNGYTRNLNPCPRAYRPAAGAGDPPATLVISPTCGSNAAQDDDRHESWRVSVSINPTDTIHNDFVYWGINEHNIGSSWVPFRLGGPFTPILFGNAFAPLLGFPTAATVLADQRARGVRAIMSDEQDHTVREDGVSNITSIELGGLTLKNIYGFRSSNQEQHRDQDGSILPYVQQDTYTAGRVKTHTDELQLLGSLLDDKVKFVVGGFLSRDHRPGQRTFAYLYQFTPTQLAILTSSGLSSLILPNPLTGGVPPADFRTKTNALFGNLDIDLAGVLPGLRLSGGYRYTWTTLKTKSPQNLVGGLCLDVPTRNYTVDLATCTRLSTREDKGYNYSATIQYDVAENSMIYLSTRRGFKPGGANEIAVVDPNFFFYAPETITDYEIGLKSQFDLGGVRVRANIAAYTSTYKNVQRSEVVQQSSGAPASTTFNAQQATIKGIEPELNFRFGDAIDLSLFYSYLDAKFDKYEVPGPGGTLINKSGTDFSAVSKHTIGATLVVHAPIPERLGGLTATANLYYRSSQTFADSNLNQPADLTVPGYTVVNARLDWAVANTGLTLSAAVSNLFDKTYAVGGADYTGSIVGYAINNYGPPRMIRIGAAFRF